MAPPMAEIFARRDERNGLITDYVTNTHSSKDQDKPN